MPQRRPPTNAGSNRNLRLVARVAELHRTIVLEGDDGHEAARLGAAEAPADPVSWGHLSVGARLAAGSFGQIYRAHDPQLNREVALKLLRGSIAVFRPVERLLAEARTLARVRHPNVVTVYGADVRDGAAGLWMELVDGQTLDAWLRTNGVMGSGEAAAVGTDLCRALAAVHAARLVHGDVKAQNVMRENGGRIVLMDFGAGRAQGGDAGGVAGTPMYLAPEVLAGEPPTIQSDLYSLGVLLFHLLTAAYPYSGADLDGLRAAHADRTRTWLRDLRPDLPDALVQSIERAIDADPARRFATAGEMERALATSLHPFPQTAPDRVAPPIAFPRTRFAIGALALLCVVVGLIVWSGRARSVAVPSEYSVRSPCCPMKDLSGSVAPSHFCRRSARSTHHDARADSGLTVTSRTSVLQFKDSRRPPERLQRHSDVDAALESDPVGASGSRWQRRPREGQRQSYARQGRRHAALVQDFERTTRRASCARGGHCRAIAGSVRDAITPENRFVCSGCPADEPRGRGSVSPGADAPGRVRSRAAAVRRSTPSNER